MDALDHCIETNWELNKELAAAEQLLRRAIAQLVWPCENAGSLPEEINAFLNRGW